MTEQLDFRVLKKLDVSVKNLEVTQYKKLKSRKLLTLKSNHIYYDKFNSRPTA